MQGSHPSHERYARGIPLDLICVAVLIIYYLHFALQSLPAQFRADDLRNMVGYWSEGPLNLIRANLFFWKPTGRPLAALYYLPLHRLFDLDPIPYRIATITLVGAAIPVAYALGWSLTRSRSVAFLASLAWCYHPQLANLVFTNAFVFDVLCSLFYLAALVCYVGIREQGRALAPVQLFACLALYACALNSKEMAVTLPVIVLIYELLKYYHASERPSFLRWIWHDASPGLAGGLVAAIHVYEKTYGPSGVSLHPEWYEAYIPHYSWHAFITTNTNFISQIFFLFPKHTIPGAVLLAGWALVFLYAFLRRDRALQLMAFWVVITPLPLAFVFPRGGACLVIILFGWAMIFAQFVSDLSALIMRLSGLRKVATLPVRGVVTIVVAMLLAAYVERQNPRIASAWLRVGKKESHVINAFRALNLRPKPGSKILLTDDVFRSGPTAGVRSVPANVAKLLWNDHSLKVYLEGVDPLNADAMTKMDYILAVHEDRVEILREPL